MAAFDVRSGEKTSVVADPAGRAETTAADALVVDTRTGFGVRLRRALGSIDRRMWFGTAAVFLLAIVAITGFEVATGKPVSATVSRT